MFAAWKGGNIEYRLTSFLLKLPRLSMRLASTFPAARLLLSGRPLWPGFSAISPFGKRALTKKQIQVCLYESSLNVRNFCDLRGRLWGETLGLGRGRGQDGQFEDERGPQAWTVAERVERTTHFLRGQCTAVQTVAVAVLFCRETEGENSREVFRRNA